jgi:predicted dehydrogenase/nucleoside-diphosphate-sugar epimerase
MSTTATQQQKTGHVLITGASGFLGGHLTELFLDAGYRVRALVRPTSRTQQLEAAGVELVEGDLKDHVSLRRAVEGMDIVVHAASTMAGVPAEYVEATVNGTRALIEAAEQEGVRRFVYVSSIAVHEMNGSDRRITEETPYESDPRFLSNYVTSKIGAEEAVFEAAERGRLEAVVIRPGLMYGPGGKWNVSRMGYAVGRKRYVVIGNGRNELPVCYVRNCAGAILKAAEADDHSGEAFNIVDDERFTQIEYLRRLRDDARPYLKINRVPYILARTVALCGETMGKLLHLPWPIRTPYLIGCHRRLDYSNRKARTELDWEPGTDKEAALAETMRYYAESEKLSRRARPEALGRPVPGAPPVRACIIGGGMIGREHLKILRGMKNAEVLAVCDLDEEAARELAAEHDVPASYADAAAMIESEAPDVVHILTPPQSHAALAEIAIRHGCHVLVEKPMTLDAPEAERLAELAREKGVKLGVDHNKLYDPVTMKARRLVESGAVGKVLWVESYCGFDLGSNPASRYMVPGGGDHWTFGIPGGLYQNLAPHPLCLALELLGEPAEIHTCARYGKVLPHAPTDELRVMLETPEAGGVVTISIAASPRVEYLKIYGTRMIVFVDLLNQWVISESVMRGMPKAISRALMNVKHGLTMLVGTAGGMLKVLRKKWTPYKGMDYLLREFYRAVQADEAPPVTAEEGVQIMRVMDKIWRSVGDEKLHR